MKKVITNIVHDRQLLICIGLFIASAVLLTAMMIPFGVWPLAWVALVPMVLASWRQVKTWKLVASAWMVGWVYWVGNMYWLWYVTSPGHVALSLYLSAYWAIAVLMFRFGKDKHWPMTLLVPVVWVGMETLQGYIATGVAWRFLSHSQYTNITLLQIADIFGGAGVSFIVAMASGAIADVIVAYESKKLIALRSIAAVAAFAAVVGAALLYGQWRMDQYDSVVSKGPLVASVQSNVPLEVKESPDNSGQIFADMLYDSNMAMDAKPVLVVWPETMVQEYLNPDILRYVDPNAQAQYFDAALKRHAKNGNAYVLVGAYGGTAKIKDGYVVLDKKFNTAFMYRPDGTKDPQTYNKIHLVPFGEVVPFKKSCPPLYRIFMWFTPYDYDYSLDYGEQYTRFAVDANGNEYHFGVLICYEDTVPYVGRNLTVDVHGNKSVDWLVNISNDGWFSRFVDRQVIPSTELRQHTAVCALRAVENRVPIVRSVNTGISCMIDSQGQIRDGFAVASRLTQKAMDRRGMAGWFADFMPIDSRVSFFSVHGQILDYTCATLFCAIAVLQFVGYKRKKAQSRRERALK